MAQSASAVGEPFLRHMRSIRAGPGPGLASRSHEVERVHTTAQLMPSPDRNQQRQEHAAQEVIPATSCPANGPCCIALNFQKKYAANWRSAMLQSSGRAPASQVHSALEHLLALDAGLLLLRAKMHTSQHAAMQPLQRQHLCTPQCSLHSVDQAY